MKYCTIYKREIINKIKKKKYSGNSVIRKYEATNTSRIFSRGVIKTNFDFIHKDTSGSNYQQIKKIFKPVLFQ